MSNNVAPRTQGSSHSDDPRDQSGLPPTSGQSSHKLSSRQPGGNGIGSQSLASEFLYLAIVSILVYGCVQWFVVEEDPNKRLFTAQELSKYSGESTSRLYLAILGQVFDVTRGRKHYGPGGSYSIFAGRDASRAFITGDFVKDLNQQVEDLTDKELKSLIDWRDFYHKDYTYKGRLISRFYSPDGQATAVLEEVQRRARQLQVAKQREQQESKTYSECGVSWNMNTGGEVWCEQGYPRQILVNGASHCGCVSDSQPTSHRQPYPGCRPDETRCILPLPGSVA